MQTIPDTEKFWPKQNDLLDNQKVSRYCRNYSTRHLLIRQNAVNRKRFSHRRSTIPASSPASWVWTCSAVFRRAAAPFSSSSLFCPAWRPAQYFRKELVEQTISVGDLIDFFSKQLLFRVVQIAQQMAARPIIWNCFLLGIRALIQCQNCPKEVGLWLAPKT